MPSDEWENVYSLMMTTDHIVVPFLISEHYLRTTGLSLSSTVRTVDFLSLYCHFVTLVKVCSLKSLSGGDLLSCGYSQAKSRRVVALQGRCFLGMACSAGQMLSRDGLLFSA